MAGSDVQNRIIGTSERRPDARRLLHGRATFLDDVHMPGMFSVAFLRSPHAHARIRAIDTDTAGKLPGVVRVVTGADLGAVCKPWGTSPQFAGMIERTQTAMPTDRVCHQGQAVVAVVAEDRATAEDAVELIEVSWELLPAAADLRGSLDQSAALAHPDLPNNLAFAAQLGSGPVDDAFAGADLVIEDAFTFARVTGAPMETRGVIANYMPAEESLTVYQSQTSPHMLQSLYADLLGLEEHRVRVICPNIGGSFGVKIHLYADEIATCAISRLIGRPVKFVADRAESFMSDIHAREHRILARMALSRDGRFLAFDVEDLFGIGPFSNFPLSSAHEGMGAVRMMATPYRVPKFRGRLQVAFQNKGITGQYRGVGHPIACAVTESLVDQAAGALGLAPEEIRRRNYVRDDEYPYQHPTGIKLEALSHQACLAKLLGNVDIEALRREQRALREGGIFRGFGMAAFVEVTAPGPAAYGNLGIPLTTQDSLTLRLEPSGDVRCLISVTDQGQGTHTVIGQIIADTLGVPLAKVAVVSGDSLITPYGSGAWASRATAIGGELALKAAEVLRQTILSCAAGLLQSDARGLGIAKGIIRAENGGAEISLSKLAEIIHFRPQLLPQAAQTSLSVSMHFGHDWPPYVPTNGIQASYVEVEPLTGRVRPLKHWAVDDFGTIINPMLVAEQVRGGVAQGIGEALLEEIRYDENGQLTNGSFVDYLLPKATDIPDIHIDHVETPWPHSRLGAKGAGEAGMTASLAAVLNAVNDALKPFGCRVTDVPLTPERILGALGKL